METADWALIVSVIALFVSTAAIIWSSKASKAANDIQQAVLDIEKGRRFDEVEEHITRQAEKFAVHEKNRNAQIQISWSGSDFSVTNQGPHDALDVRWEVLSATGEIFTLPGQPTFATAIASGDRINVFTHSVNEVSSVQVTVSWSDGQSDGHTVGPVTLPEHNTISL